MAAIVKRAIAAPPFLYVHTVNFLSNMPLLQDGLFFRKLSCLSYGKTGSISEIDHINNHLAVIPEAAFLISSNVHAGNHSVIRR